MSKYTTELRFIIESGFPLFTFNYPFYDESKREEFQNRFIKHFYFREIGLETAELFRHFLEIKFNEVLPYYNEMFRTAQIKYDPLETYDIPEEYTKDTEGASTSSATGSQTSEGSENATTESNTNGDTSLTTTVEGSTTSTRTGESNTARDETANNTETGTETTNSAFSDTPQGRVAIDVVNGDHVSKLEHVAVSRSSENNHTGAENTTTSNSDSANTTESNTTTQSGTNSATASETATRTNTNTASTQATQTGSATGTESFKRRMYGDMGVRPASYLLEEHLRFQRQINTIELQFFEECNDLFMELW